MLGVIGATTLSPKASSRLTDLANILGDDGDFELEFTSKHAEEKQVRKTKFGKENDHIENLMLQSRKFFVNEIERTYVDSDPIFFIREPNTQRIQLNNCLSCDSKFENLK